METVVAAVARINPALTPLALREIASRKARHFGNGRRLLLRIFNDCHAEDGPLRAHGGTYYKWSIHVEVEDADSGLPAPELLQQVAFNLHPTFSPSTVAVSSAPFSVSRTGWGTFNVGIDITDITGKTHCLEHALEFGDDAATASLKVHALELPAQQTTPTAGSFGGLVEAGFPRMEGVSEAEMHGQLGVGKGWNAPLLVTFCESEARPGYRSMQAHEYTDDDATLHAKIRVMADLIRRAKHCLAYTGAGISTASGIDDYASRATTSVATGSGATTRAPKRTGLDAEPTFAHFTMAALERSGLLHHWVQQNHDGLPQKARYPQEKLNEIHGAWFDPSNPVVPMSGSLRTDLFHWMLKEEQETDMVLTMGTSLCGMNADRMVKTPAKKCIRNGVGLGAVIVGFQRTAMDNLASLRIFAPIDQVMLLLALEMNLAIDPTPYTLAEVPDDARIAGSPHSFLVPYDKHGRPSQDGKCRRWDLAIGSRIRLTGGPGKGFEGVVLRTPDTAKGRDCTYTVQLPCTREGDQHFGKLLCAYAFGVWFVESAVNGTLDRLPLVNVD